MLIYRIIEEDIKERLRESDKLIVLYGARQVGKTTLVESVLKQLNYKTLMINADEERFTDILSSRDSRKLFELVEGYELLFIDEAQRIPDIGINLKILIDQKKDLKIIATGSSSFELANKLAEPLTGRKWTFTLFPISQLELKKNFNTYELKSRLEPHLIWGGYPEIYQLKGTDLKISYLRELSSDYLYKDILKLEEIRHPHKIRDLLKLLAYQVGQLVSLNELGNHLGMSKETVSRYIDLLEKSFIIFKLTGFNRNLRKEITKMNKYYFYDLGFRNSVIDNFKALKDRDDQGALWENFLVVERLKRNAYSKQFVAPYFWRTYTGAEIDYIEESEGALRGYEFKWVRKNIHAPKTWLEKYQQASWEMITNENWLDFVT